MQYKVGDVVWYLVLGKPCKIEKGCIEEVGTDGRLYKVTGNGKKWYRWYSEIYPTKEALLAAIDPPTHDFTVGQTVWCLINNQTVSEDIIVAIKKVRGSDYFKLKENRLYPMPLDTIFATPEEAFAKAEEVRVW
ncbi:MAG: hypothetical protein IM613_12325 [Cytophagales bacterium]|nr:hypothetical protein [Cytophagales bacterium]